MSNFIVITLILNTMKSSTSRIPDNTMQNFSKYDESGTDPNRYASVSNESEARTYLNKMQRSAIPGLKVNVPKPERIAMIAVGAYLLYRALKKKDDQRVAEGIAAGTLLFRGVSGYCPAYDFAKRNHVMQGKNISITSSLTVNKPVEEVYNAWRRLENLPLFMKHLHSVRELDQYKSEWKANIPGGLGTIGWEAEILMDEPNQLLSWHSLPGSTIHNSGKVRFYENGNSTDLEVTISYHAPLGKPGESIAKLLNPIFDSMVTSDVENFKEYIE